MAVSCTRDLLTEAIVAETGREKPRILDVLAGEAEETRETLYGTVGLLYGGPEIRAEWVSKRGEAVDPNWFSRDEVDFLCVLAGHLRVEFEREDFFSTILKSGQVLIFPPGVRCRAYRWPRETSDAAVFVAVYPAVDAEGDVWIG